MRLKLLALVMLIYTCAVPVQAQQTNCTNVSDSLVSDNRTFSQFDASLITSETVTYKVNCTANGSTFSSSQNATTATGATGTLATCPSSGTCQPICNPSFSFRIFTSTAMVDSTFTNDGQSKVFDKFKGCQNGVLNENITHCSAVACLPKCFSGCGGSPIILDLNGNGIDLTSAANGVTFDLSGTGNPIQIAWTAPGANNAFLALPGADGLVHNGTQLFGNFTPQPASSTPNGFAALAVYDQPANGGNGDGIIDSRDAVFASLRLWIDANHDGISQSEELHTLPSLGVNSISLTYKTDEKTDQYGNVFRYRAQINPGDTTNTGRMAYDVFLVTVAPLGTAKNLPASLNPVGAYKCLITAPTEGGMVSTTGKLR